MYSSLSTKDYDPIMTLSNNADVINFTIDSTIMKMFQCHVCNQRFNKTNRAPTTLSCGHTFCAFCVTELTSFRFTKCYTCNRTTIIMRSDMSKNYALFELLDKLDILDKDDETHDSDQGPSNSIVELIKYYTPKYLTFNGEFLKMMTEYYSISNDEWNKERIEQCKWIQHVKTTFEKIMSDLKDSEDGKPPSNTCKTKDTRGDTFLNRVITLRRDDQALMSLAECGVCYENYNRSSRSPYSLPCGHTFCKECVTKTMKHRFIRCGYCRAVNTIGFSGVYRNAMLLALLEKLNLLSKDAKGREPVMLIVEGKSKNYEMFIRHIQNELKEHTKIWTEMVQAYHELQNRRPAKRQPTRYRSTFYDKIRSVYRRLFRTSNDLSPPQTPPKSKPVSNSISAVPSASSPQ